MNDIKPIKTRADYEEAVALLTALIDKNPETNSPEDAQIQILVALIEDFESSTLPDYQVDPIEAIKLRMEQLGLKDVDLVPYLGTRSRVSEVLSEKRPLTVAMIRNLEEGLGVPASSLVGNPPNKKKERWNSSTLTLMAHRGYFGENNKDLPPKEIRGLGLLRNLFAAQPLTSQTLLRQSNYRDISKVDKYLMEAWANKVLNEALRIIQDEKISSYRKDLINEKTLAELFKLSAKPDGIREVIKSLKNLKIIVVVEPHLPSTRLDGATLFTEQNPVIGLTLRYDRLDHFWFTLAHELSHVFLHYGKDYTAFYDQLFEASKDLEEIEQAADQLAGELLIPLSVWKTSPLRFASTPTLVKAFAQQIGVHESIVAGRIRHDSKDWSVLSNIVNEQGARDLFEEKLW